MKLRFIPDDSGGETAFQKALYVSGEPCHEVMGVIEKENANLLKGACFEHAY
jgi:hypothetical protein